MSTFLTFWYYGGSKIHVRNQTNDVHLLLVSRVTRVRTLRINLLIFITIREEGSVTGGQSAGVGAVNL
jgi:hypothetical protein